MIYKKTLCFLCLLFFSILGFPSLLNAQQTGTFPVLSNAGGYYQHPKVKELYLQIKVSGDKLEQIRGWDGREMLLNQQSESDFSNSEGYSLSFIKNNNEISAVKIGQELWTKIPGFAPEHMPKLSSAQVSTILDDKAEQLVAAINSNSEKKLLDYVAANFSAAIRSALQNDFLPRIQRVYRATAGVKFHKRIYFNENAFFGEYQYVSEDLNNVYEFSLKLDKDLKVKLYNSRIVYSQDPIKKVSSEQALVSDLDKTLKRLAQKDVFSGAVLFAKGDQVLYEYACGSAIKETDRKNTVDTRFNLGSMNKMFTAVGVMQLIEQGKLNLNDPISKFVDSTWLPTQLANKIQIRHLLNHTAGTGDFFSEAILQAPLSQFETLDGYKPYVKKNLLEFEPGTSWSYSNSGMLLLGVIIEKVSGVSYFDYVQEHIYKVAGMKRSASRNLGEKSKLDNYAVGYIPKADGSYQTLLNSVFTMASSAGGGYSTITDLHRFGAALMSGKLLNDSSKNKMFKDELGKQYGYGFQFWDSPGKRVVGHGGGAPGVSAAAYFFPDTRYMVIVLSNYDRAAVELGEYMLNQVKSIEK